MMPPAGNTMVWPAVEKQKTQGVYIMLAFCEVRERGVSTREAMLERYKSLVENMTEIPSAAQHYTIEQVQNEMLRARKGHGLTAAELWSRATDIRRDCIKINSFYTDAKVRGLLGMTTDEIRVEILRCISTPLARSTLSQSAWLSFWSAWHPMRSLKVQVAAAALSLGNKLAPVLWYIAKAMHMKMGRRLLHGTAAHVWAKLGPCGSPPLPSSLALIT